MGGGISIHKALAGLDFVLKLFQPIFCDFNPQGPRGPRRYVAIIASIHLLISIHKALAGLDIPWRKSIMSIRISIHKALAGLDIMVRYWSTDIPAFQSTRPSRASTSESA